MTLDDLRVRFPALGFGLYALDVLHPVQIEIHFPNGTYMTLEAETVASAIDKTAEYLIPPAPVEESEDIFG